MDIQQLIYFSTAARCGSFTKAATQLNVSQPTISIAIKKLEKELDIPLFEEKKKPLTLTSIGERILERSNQIIKEYNNILLEAKDSSIMQPTVIRLGIPLTLFNNLLLCITRDFLPKHPNCQLKIYQYGVETIREKIANDELDVGIICQFTESENVDSVPLKPLEFLAYFSPEHPFSKEEVITPALLDSQSVLLADVAQNHIEEHIHRYIDEHQIQVTFSGHGMLFPHTLIQLAEENIGITFLESDFSKNKYRVMSAPLDPPLTLPLAVGWNKKKYISAAQKQLIRFIAKLTSTREE